MDYEAQKLEKEFNIVFSDKEKKFVEKYLNAKISLNNNYRLKEFFINYKERITQCKTLDKLLKELKVLLPEDIYFEKRRKQKGYNSEHISFYLLADYTILFKDIFLPSTVLKQKIWINSLSTRTDKIKNKTILILENGKNFIEEEVESFIKSNQGLDTYNRLLDKLKKEAKLDEDLKHLFEDGILF